MRLITDDEEKIINWDIRAEVIFPALLSLVDPVTDILVINEWIRYFRNGFSFTDLNAAWNPEFQSSVIADETGYVWALISYVGICILVLSQLVSALVYVCWDENDVTCSGVFLHLLGFGSVYHGMTLIKNPVPHPWELKVGESNEVGAQTWLRYFHVRAVESVVEALPFAIFQTFVLVYTQSYNLFLISSAVISMVSTALPVAYYVNLRCYDHGISPLSIIEKLLITSLWTWDMVGRSLPLIYLVAHCDLFSYRWLVHVDSYIRWPVIDHYDFWLILFLGYWLVGLIFLYTYRYGKNSNFRKIFELPALALMLMFTSHPKLRNVGWMSGVETFVRFLISLLLAIQFYFKYVINLWQLQLFSILTIISGCLQMYFFFRVKAGHYKGYRVCVEEREDEEENTLEMVQEQTNNYEMYEGDSEHEFQTSVEFESSDVKKSVSLLESPVLFKSDVVNYKHMGVV